MSRKKGENRESVDDELFSKLDTPLNELCVLERGGGLGSRPKKMYGERLGDGSSII